MHLREVQIEDDKSIPDSGTQTIDINLRDPITEIILRFRAQNDENLNNQPPELQVTKVELVDGGETFHSLNGPMAVAQAVTDLGRWPHHWYDERDTVRQRIDFPIRFGRFLADPEFGFDPTKLRNPQIKFTYSDQAGYIDNSLRLGVTARVMEGVPSPSRILLTKEIEAFTSVGSGDKRVDLPTDYPYRRLFIRGYAATDLLTSIITNYKLDCDVGKVIPFDLEDHEMQDLYREEFGPYNLEKHDYAQSPNIGQAWLGQTSIVIGHCESRASPTQCYSASYHWYHQFRSDWSGAQNDGHMMVLCVGYFPHSTMVYQFGRSNDPETWFPCTQYGDVDLILSDGTADAAVAIAVQQSRPHPVTR